MENFGLVLAFGDRELERTRTHRPDLRVVNERDPFVGKLVSNRGFKFHRPSETKYQVTRNILAFKANLQRPETVRKTGRRAGRPSSRGAPRPRAASFRVRCR